MSRQRERAGHSLQEAAPVFAALGDTTRLGLMARLAAEGPLSTSRLGEGTGVTRQAVTKHLETLAVAGLVRDGRLGRERIWQLEPASLAVARRELDRISHQWNAAIGRLKAFVETAR